MKFTFIAALLSSFLFAQSADAQVLTLESAFAVENVQSASLAAPRPEPVSPHLALSTSLGGLLGVAGGFGLAWGPALATDHRCDSPDSSELCGFDTLIILSTTTWGTPATTALGIWAAGRASGGRGNYGLTLLGSAVGGTLGAGLGTMIVIGGDSRGASIAGFMAIPVLEWVGGLIAYHLSHNARVKSDRRGRRMLPTVQLEERGASLQLSGAF